MDITLTRTYGMREIAGAYHAWSRHARRWQITVMAASPILIVRLRDRPQPIELHGRDGYATFCRTTVLSVLRTCRESDDAYDSGADTE